MAILKGAPRRSSYVYVTLPPTFVFYAAVSVPKQLPDVAFGRCGNPDSRESFREQEIENEPGVALIGLLFAHFAGANLCGVPDPQFVTEFREQTLEPVNRAGSFDAHAHRFLRTLQAPVERVSFAAFVVQSALHKHLCGFFSGHGNLLIACMEITSYNQHRSAPFSEPWSLNSYQVYSVEGADNVIQSGDGPVVRPAQTRQCAEWNCMAYEIVALCPDENERTYA